jgi:serine protease Do
MKVTRMDRAWVAGWLLAVIASGFTPARAMDEAALYRKCEAACVEILVEGRHAGSGWFADTNGTVVTAGHVFERPDPPLELLCANGERVPAELLGVDRGHDLACLRATGPARSWPFLPVSRKPAALGNGLREFGSPLFRAGAMQTGRLASPHDRYEFTGAFVEYARTRMLGAMMQPGTSGGPWVNGRGEVVGVQSSIMSLDGRPIGVAFMSPGDAVRRLLRARVHAHTPTLGAAVDELWQQPAETLQQLPPKLEGLVLSVVRGDGPAAKAGLVVKDVLLTVDGQHLLRVGDLLSVVRAHQPGEAVAVRYRRPAEDQEREVKVTLGRAEDMWPGLPAGK